MGIPGGVIPNVYPPFFALALAPLTRLGYDTAYDSWLVMNCILLACCMFVLERTANLGRAGRMVLRLAFLLSWPVGIALFQGQTSMLTLAALTTAYLALSAGREVPGGVALGLTLIKPQYVILFLLLLILQRKRRALFAFVATALALFAIPAILLGPAVDWHYAGTLAQAAHWGDQVGGFGPRYNRSFAGFLQLALPHRFAGTVTVVVDIATLALFAGRVLRKAPFDLLFALAVVTSLLISQHVLIHDLVLLLIPVAIALRYRRGRVLPLAVILSAMYGLIGIGFPLSIANDIQLPTLGMVALAAWLYLTGPRVSMDASPVFSASPAGALAGSAPNAL
jgi:hypothetical protein